VIVCLCRGVSERTVCAAIRAGAATVEDITSACGAGGDCGACCTMLAELVERAGRLAVIPSR
jgi:bacterioferritin-associated ferredoxin